MGEKKRDRSGELFQNAFTENEGARRPLIEQAQHELKDDEQPDEATQHEQSEKSS